jgi:3-deoxy-D-arabino-heptulosonate 7-phosphate (DAHP) synthase
MKVNIAHNPAQEAFAQQLGTLLNDNGYKIQYTTATQEHNGVAIDVALKNGKEQKEDSQQINYAVSMTSAFVEVDHMPGY